MYCVIVFIWARGKCNLYQEGLIAVKDDLDSYHLDRYKKNAFDENKKIVITILVAFAVVVIVMLVYKIAF